MQPDVAPVTGNEASSASTAAFATVPEPSDEEVLAYVRAQWMPLLVRRARVTIGILLGATAAFTVSALWVLPPDRRGVVVSHAAHGAVQIVLYLALTRTRRSDVLTWIPVIGGIATSWIVAWGATMSGHTISTALLVPGYLLGAAALMPWGLSRQSVLVVGAMAAFIANVHAVSGGYFFSAGYFVSIPVLAMAATSLYIAYEFDRTRLEAGREELRRQRAEAALVAMNVSLEERVASRTAELERAVQELRTFSYTVSHDLRAPLRGINGFSQTLCEEFGAALGPDGLTLLDRVRAASRRMGQMIDAMLTLGRVTSSTIRRSSIDLARLARTIADELDAADPHRRVEWRIADSVRADGDPILLHMLIENLLSNAHKFTRSRDPARIELGMIVDADATTYYVRDNGIGFDMAHAQHLFEEFHRLHNDSSYEGTGVGLATVRRIVQRHGGKVWAEATPAGGATFYFTLGEAGAASNEAGTTAAAI
ncbi:MAG TPA: ATP-binding protein [Candidatus Limnocylindrales bacterium]|nr:ATP-binding protein [Candidatus Limnocylindrales bacterium]